MNMYLLWAIISTVFAFILFIGIFVSRKKKCGTIVFNHAPDKPIFELHFEEDPNSIRDGEEIVFVLRIRD